MGDRFYTQQKEYKPGLRLKKDIVKEIEKSLGFELKSLINMTKGDLEKLNDKLCIHKR